MGDMQADEERARREEERKARIRARKERLMRLEQEDGDRVDVQEAAAAVGRGPVLDEYGEPSTSSSSIHRVRTNSHLSPIPCGPHAITFLGRSLLQCVRLFLQTKEEDRFGEAGGRSSSRPRAMDHRATFGEDKNNIADILVDAPVSRTHRSRAVPDVDQDTLDRSTRAGQEGATSPAQRRRPAQRSRPAAGVFDEDEAAMLGRVGGGDASSGGRQNGWWLDGDSAAGEAAGFGTGTGVGGGSRRGGAFEQSNVGAAASMQAKEMERLRRQNEELKKIAAAQRRVLEQSDKAGGTVSRGDVKDSGLDDGMSKYLQQVEALGEDNGHAAASSLPVGEDRGGEDDWAEQEAWLARQKRPSAGVAGRLNRGQHAGDVGGGGSGPEARAGKSRRRALPQSTKVRDSIVWFPPFLVGTCFPVCFVSDWENSRDVDLIPAQEYRRESTRHGCIQ